MSVHRKTPEPIDPVNPTLASRPDSLPFAGRSTEFRCWYVPNMCSSRFRSNPTLIRVMLVLTYTAGTTFIGLVLTLVCWNLQIEGRAFHCTDDMGLGDFFMGIDNHRKAGDVLLPGWSWDGVELIRWIYLGVFFLIGLLPVALPVIKMGMVPLEWAIGRRKPTGTLQ